jgi:cob(I)alamin adenosyltransferase
MKVYTKTGDDGTTGLFHGGRVDKHDLRTSAYGTVDETVSALGLARVELSGHLHDLVLRIQRELFVVGAQLATLPEHWDRLEVGVSRVDDAMVDALDALIDASVERHPLPRHFVVPGGNRAAAAIDLARTICRRAERVAVALAASEDVSEHGITYLNRLSDAFFVFGRFAAHRDGEPEPLWDSKAT